MDWLLVTVTSIYFGATVSYTPFAHDWQCARAAIEVVKLAEIARPKDRKVEVSCVDMRKRPS